MLCLQASAGFVLLSPLTPALVRRQVIHSNYAILMTIKLLIRNKKVLDVAIVISQPRSASDSPPESSHREWWMGKMSQMWQQMRESPSENRLRFHRLLKFVFQISLQLWCWISDCWIAIGVSPSRYNWRLIDHQTKQLLWVRSKGFPVDNHKSPLTRHHEPCTKRRAYGWCWIITTNWERSECKWIFEILCAAIYKRRRGLKPFTSFIVKSSCCRRASDRLLNTFHSQADH